MQVGSSDPHVHGHERTAHHAQDTEYGRRLPRRVRGLHLHGRIAPATRNPAIGTEVTAVPIQL